MVVAAVLALPRAAHASVLLAQDDGGRNYVFPYFVVGLVTLIGLAVACRPAKREDRVPDKFDV